MIYMDFKQIEEAQNILEYFYGINTSSCIIDDDVNFSDSLVNIFNQVMERCCCYSPFPNNPTAFGVFGESPHSTAYSNNFLLLHILYTHCIIYALQVIKHLAYEKEEETVCTKIHNDSSLLHNGTYPFMPKHEAQLCAGHFSKYGTTSPAKFYDMDSVQWDSNRKILRNKIQSNSFYKNLFAIHNLNLPNGKTTYIDAANSDFISHLLLNKELRHLIALLDKYSQKESLTTSDCKTLNNNIIKNDLYSPVSFLRNLAQKANIPITIDSVDAILFSHQLESAFHIDLYTSFLSSMQKNLFNEHIHRFTKNCRTTYAFLDPDNAYLSFISYCANALHFPHGTATSYLINYALMQLDDFGKYQYRTHYPLRLFNDDTIVRKVKRKKFPPLEPSYNEWLFRVEKYIIILGEIFLPLLEKSFLITLLNTYNDCSYCQLMDQLYEHISNNLYSFEVNYLYLKSNDLVSKSLKNTVYEKFLLPTNFNEYLNKFDRLYHSNMDIHLEPNIHITKIYIEHLYSNKNFPCSKDLLLKDLATNYFHAEYHDPTNYPSPLYRDLSAQIVNHLIK